MSYVCYTCGKKTDCLFPVLCEIKQRGANSVPVKMTAYCCRDCFKSKVKGVEE